MGTQHSHRLGTDGTLLKRKTEQMEEVEQSEEGNAPKKGKNTQNFQGEKTQPWGHPQLGTVVRVENENNENHLMSHVNNILICKANKSVRTHRHKVLKAGIDTHGSFQIHPSCSYTY